LFNIDPWLQGPFTRGLSLAPTPSGQPQPRAHPQIIRVHSCGEPRILAFCRESRMVIQLILLDINLVVEETHFSLQVN
ncbi:MAG: hypothetical protein QW211_06040, partial [Desulfurococcaceae archaeon]